MLEIPTIRVAERLQSASLDAGQSPDLPSQYVEIEFTRNELSDIIADYVTEHFWLSKLGLAFCVGYRSENNDLKCVVYVWREEVVNT